MAKNYTAEQVADMIMNDDIGEMDSADSLDEESSSSRQVLIEKCSVRNRPSKRAKTRGEISNHRRTIRTRGGISNREERTVRTRRSPKL